MVKLDYKRVFKDWEPFLRDSLLETPYMDKLITRIQEDYKSNTIRPAKSDIFRAFKVTSFADTRVVILGQDPYPNKRANGLAFGNEEEDTFVSYSPSLDKIYKCVEKTVYGGLKLDFDPTLVSWAQQGVLLLNSALTVVDGTAGSRTKWWRAFIRETILALNENKTGLIFVLLGGQARLFEPFINKKAHHVLTYVHPAWSARNGTDWNCPHFVKINQIIEEQNGKEFKIKW